MHLARLFPHLDGLRLRQLVIEPECLTLVVVPVRRAAACPRCQRWSSRLHSHYERTLADLPWGHVQSASASRLGAFAAPTDAARAASSPSAFLASFERRHAYRGTTARPCRIWPRSRLEYPGPQPGQDRPSAGRPVGPEGSGSASRPRESRIKNNISWSTHFAPKTKN